jgi:hypothetical protein
MQHSSLKRNVEGVQRKWEQCLGRIKQQEGMLDEVKHNLGKFWSAFKGQRASMMQFDVRQLHTYWNAFYGGSG